MQEGEITFLRRFAFQDELYDSIGVNRLFVLATRFKFGRDAMMRAFPRRLVWSLLGDYRYFVGEMRHDAAEREEVTGGPACPARSGIHRAGLAFTFSLTREASQFCCCSQRCIEPA